MDKTNELITLGSALEAPGLWLAVAPRVRPEIFETNRTLASAICDLTEAGKPTDPQTVKAELESRGVACTLADLLTIANYAAFQVETLEAAVEALHESARLEAIRQLATTMTAQTRDRKAHSQDILAKATAALAEIGARSTQNGVYTMAEMLNPITKELSRKLATGIKTGIADLDTVTGGLKPGELVVLGARPSMGKTALALNCVRNAAQAGHTVAVFSLEMSAQQVVHRVLADLSDVNLARITTHNLSQTDMTRIVNAANAMHRFKIFIGEHDHNIGPVCRQIRHKHGLDLVVIDYLQLMKSDGRSREQEVARLSQNLKSMARELGCPVLVLCQLNRQVEQRSCKRPMLSDLRESGAIEQDADIALLLWRPGYYDDSLDQTEAELNVAKHRNGPTGLVYLRWVAHATRFEMRKAK